MKTPEEIKKGLKCCSVEAMHCGPEDPKCAYDCGSEECIRNLMHDALAYIKQLEEKVKSFKAETMEAKKWAERFERERDAAVRDCARFPCYTCKERENGDNCCQCKCESATSKRSHHEWRGPCEENGVQKEENT